MTLPIGGVWLGSLSVGAASLRLQLHLTPGATGEVACTLDSLDQKAKGIPCSEVEVQNRAISFSVPAVGGGWKGTLSADNNTLTGTWSQGGKELPLTMAKEDKAIETSTP